MSQELTTTTTNPARPALAYLASLRTAVSRLTMTTELRRVAVLLGVLKPDPRRPDQTIGDWEGVPWAQLNAAKIEAIYAQVSGSVASRNKTLSALKGVARMAYKDNMMSEDTYRKITLIRGQDAQADDVTVVGRMIEDWEISALLRACAADKAAGIVGERKTTHSLRHSAISNVVRNGTVQQAQAMARHANIATTGIYIAEMNRIADAGERVINYRREGVK